MEPVLSLAPPQALVQAAMRAVADAREAGRPLLLSWGRSLPAVDPLRFLASGEAPRAYFGAPQGMAVAGLGAAAVLEGRGEARFDAVRVQAEALLRGAILSGEPGAPGPCFVGGFAFGAGHEPREPWQGFPSALFFLPGVAVHRGAEGSWATVNRLVEGREEPEALARHVAALAQRAAEQPALTRPVESGAPLPAFGSQVLERDAWEARVGEALGAIRRGRLAKVVLARRVGVPLTAPLSGDAALARLAEHYADCFLYLLEPRPARPFLGASPERLLHLHGAGLESAAVAGSAPRGASPEEDEALARALLASPKERREHAIVVEHVVATLRGLGARVEAPDEPAPLRLRNVQHLHTPVRAELPGPAHALDVAAALHPTPAVAGAPTGAALAFLREREDFERGWYAGAVGWFDAAGQGEFAVALRCALVAQDEAWLFAGAGIVQGAEPAHEWDETGLKLWPMLEALGCRL